MSESKLDQIVKGAPPPDAKNPVSSRSHSATLAAAGSAVHNHGSPSIEPSDPLSTLPSSPPQIYLNLLIMEASLRAQYLTLRVRRRQHTFFLFLLTAWIACFSYLLFLRPREDGRGLGGSPYWVIEMTEKVALMCGVITGILLWGTGQWERGMRWPRRWVGVANRGLRGINAKLVVIKGPWWRELLGTLSFLFPYSSFFPSSASSYHYIESLPAAASATQNEKRLPPSRQRQSAPVEEDLSPGGDYIKLLLLPKPFSPEFREQWEVYRAEYWERENERRAQLRVQLHAQRRELAKQESGWLWWTGWHGGWWRRRAVVTERGASDVERSHQHPHTHHTHHHQHPTKGAHALGEKEGTSKASRRPQVERAGSGTASASASRSSSRHSTSRTPDGDDRPVSAAKARRGSGTSSTGGAGERRKTAKMAGMTRTASKTTMKPLPSSATAPGSRSSTLGTGGDTRSPLTRGGSFHSVSGGSDSDRR
ncbi:MAG: hypothetical protein M1837_006875 [Sclerophora amabilis]|nr:MAG: hypothetical protein M1837_006875 [Sclerophora amabilis]